MFPAILSTQRLILRKPRMADSSFIHEAVLESFDDLKPWMGWAQTIPTCAETDANTQSSIENWGISSHRMLIFDKVTNEFIGSSGFIRHDFKIPMFEIGYWCRSSKTGNGYVKEAVVALTKAAFDIGANRVELKCDKDNVKSKRVAELSGFVFEGCHVNDGLKADGTGLRSTLVFAITNKEQING